MGCYDVTIFIFFGVAELLRGEKQDGKTKVAGGLSGLHPLTDISDIRQLGSPAELFFPHRIIGRLLPRLAAAVKGEPGELKELNSPGIHIHRLADSCSQAHSHLQTFHSHHPNRLS